jgi:hypothetical protein
MTRSALGKARQKSCPARINDIDELVNLPGNEIFLLAMFRIRKFLNGLLAGLLKLI